MSAPYSYLHVHSEASYLDGMLNIQDYLQACLEFGVQATALTDHGHIAALPNFVKAAKGMGIKPIPGLEAYVVPHGQSRSVKTTEVRHLTLLATNPQGYKNLVALATKGAQNIEDGGGFYSRPRLDHQLINRHQEGLICLSGCYGGEVAKYLAEGNIHAAEQTADFYKQVFGDRYYLEIQSHKDPQGKDLYLALKGPLVALGERVSLPLVATTDSHYLHRSDQVHHDRLLAVGTKALVRDPNRFRHTEIDYHLWTPDEMSAEFGELPGALSNSLAIAERVGDALTFGHPELPELIAGASHQDYAQALTQQAQQGLSEKFGGAFGTVIPDDYQSRLQYELSIITTKPGFAQYLLIIGDLIDHLRSSQILVIPRGSAIGSLVCHVLGFSGVDPIVHDIAFERFMTPGRTELPDIDLDLPPKAASLAQSYLIRRYGTNRVGMISTVSKMKARQVLRDVARAEGIDEAIVDALAKTVPQGLSSRSLERCATDTDRDVKAFQALLDQRQIYRELFEKSVVLDNVTRQQGVHPAGVVVTKHDLASTLPLRRPNPKYKLPIVQYDMTALADLGYLKIDMLKVEYIGALQRCLELLGEDLDFLWSIRTDDTQARAVFKSLCAGYTTGCFQLSDRRMRSAIMQIKPKTIADIAVGIALYRPGPMANIPSYAARKNGDEAVSYLHPDLEPALNRTYGVMVYQDQVLLVLRALGYEWDEADAFRSAIGKKKKEKLAKLLPELKERCRLRGWKKAQATQLLKTLEPFAGYGFGVGHAYAYAYVAFWTAWMAEYYPQEWFASLLTGYVNKKDKYGEARVTELVHEAQRRGVEIYAPDVNTSSGDFVVEGKGIRVGFSAIKGVAEGAMSALLNARELGLFQDFTDFMRRTQVGPAVNSAVLSHLIDAGAFPRSWGHSAQLKEAIKQFQKWAKESVRMPSYDPFTKTQLVPLPVLPEVPALTQKDLEVSQYQTLGFRTTTPPPSQSKEPVIFTFRRGQEDLTRALTAIYQDCVHQQGDWPIVIRIYDGERLAIEDQILITATETNQFVMKGLYARYQTIPVEK